MPLDNPTPPANPISAMNNQPDKMDKALHLKLIAAWWDGELEFLYADCGWKPANRPPHSESEISRYRIRPKPTLRPWKPEEFPCGAAFKHVGFDAVKGTGRIYLPTIQEDHGVYFPGINSMVFYSFEELLKAYVHSTDGGKTWKPCGVEESQ